ncbi:MAG TPA: hypothetical protein VD769_11650 [Gaiellaceae bacterium]|nr:hypothetical protein [Gaiellaceae bacterium]
MTSVRGWGWFVAWTGVGGLLAFTLIAAASIGLLVAPFGFLALWLVLRRSPPRATASGLVSGVGLVSLLIWALNRDYRPCPESGELTLPPGATSVECGGFDALPFLVTGIVLALAGAALYALARRRG